MFVVTADQKRSRKNPDYVPSALNLLTAVASVLPFERTVGDEIQGLLAEPIEVLLATMLLSSHNQWHIGIGIGDVEESPLGSVREGRGTAFIRAREAVSRAKEIRPSLMIVGDDDSAQEANALWRLLAGVWERRSQEGWDAIFALQDNQGKQSGAAKTLGISRQALSQRLTAAMWSVEEPTHPLACRLLANAAGRGGHE